MDIRNSLDALRSLLGVNAAAPRTTQQARSGAAAAEAGLGSDSATLSSAGNGAYSLATSDTDVRSEKVVSIRAALASGGYEIPASAVAAKVVDAMLGKGS